MIDENTGIQVLPLRPLFPPCLPSSLLHYLISLPLAFLPCLLPLFFLVFVLRVYLLTFLLFVFLFFYLSFALVCNTHHVAPALDGT